MITLDYLFFIAVSLSALLAAQPFLQLYRLESYSLPRFFLRIKEDLTLARWLMRLWLRAVLAQAAVVAAYVAFQLASQFINPTEGPLFAVVSNRVMSSITMLSYALPGVFLAVSLVHFVKWVRLPPQPKLLYPARVLRLHVTLAAVLVILQLVVYQLVFEFSAFVYRLVPNVNMQMKIVIFYSLLLSVFAVTKLLLECLSIILIPRLIALATFILKPIEKAIEKRKMRDASGQGMV